jgi:hypothetical protein
VAYLRQSDRRCLPDTLRLECFTLPKQTIGTTPGVGLNPAAKLVVFIEG